MACVLVVDNHDGVRSLLLSLLSRHFELCDEAENGRQAVAKVAKFYPDVVVLDLLMPEMNGMEVVPRIRKMAPSTGIVLISGCLPPRLGLEAARISGAEAYVEKYTAVRDLIPTIEAVLQDPSRRNGYRQDDCPQTRRPTFRA
ncbi:MAG TPA: response regulator transcription factor [Terriglobia bacterium]|nr:response regulator transcription factor [Terriglobia bacterium]